MNYLTIGTRFHQLVEKELKSRKRKVQSHRKMKKLISKCWRILGEEIKEGKGKCQMIETS